MESVDGQHMLAGQALGPCTLFILQVLMIQSPIGRGGLFLKLLNRRLQVPRSAQDITGRSRSQRAEGVQDHGNESPSLGCRAVKAPPSTAAAILERLGKR